MKAKVEEYASVELKSDLVNNLSDKEKELVRIFFKNMLTLSRTLCISKNELSLFFDQCLHSNFRIWLSEIRLNAAKKMMLEYPDYSNDIISAECGFSCRTHLYRIFKTKEDRSPTKWRDFHFTNAAQNDLNWVINIFRKIPKKKQFFYRKTAKKVSHSYECDTWTGKKCTFCRRKTLYLQHERSNRNNAKDWISPDHHRGVCTHIMYYLRICHDTWVQNVSWESLEGSLAFVTSSRETAFISFCCFIHIYLADKPLVFSGVSFGKNGWISFMVDTCRAIGDKSLPLR